jgi:hypothetical protein
MREFLVCTICVLIVTPSIACDLDYMIGWTLIARKTIAGRIDKGIKKVILKGAIMIELSYLTITQACAA